MKKILATLCLLCLTSPVFAEVVTTNRFYKGLNDTCSPKISVNNRMDDFVYCSINYASAPINWTEGWSALVKADMYKLFAQTSTEKLQQFTYADERTYAPIVQMHLVSTFNILLKEFQKQGIADKKMPAELVKIYRGY